jgi:hypothetical protein
MEIPCFLACLLDIKIVHSQQQSHWFTARKKERKKADLSLHANSIHHHPRGYAAFEEHITSLFPSSENEGFSQEFQSLGAQANS